MASREAEAAFMVTPLAWPQWPFLPLVNRTRQERLGPATGVLAAFAEYYDETTKQPKPTVHLINLYALDSAQALAEAPKEVFETFDDLLNAGWQVD